MFATVLGYTARGNILRIKYQHNIAGDTHIRAEITAESLTEPGQYRMQVHLHTYIYLYMNIR